MTHHTVAVPRTVSTRARVGGARRSVGWRRWVHRRLRGWVGCRARPVAVLRRRLRLCVMTIRAQRWRCLRFALVWLMACCAWRVAVRRDVGVAARTSDRISIPGCGRMWRMTSSARGTVSGGVLYLLRRLRMAGFTARLNLGLMRIVTAHATSMLSYGKGENTVVASRAWFGRSARKVVRSVTIGASFMFCRKCRGPFGVAGCTRCHRSRFGLMR